MPTITFSNPSICTGGGHLHTDVAVNGGTAREMAFDVDELRNPLSELSAEDRAQLAMLLLKVHFAGKTRAQMRAELQAGRRSFCPPVLGSALNV